MNKETIKEYLKAFDTDETVRLTQEMIRIKSIDPPGLEKEMSEYVKSYLIKNGCDSVRAQSVEGLDEARKNIIATVKGQGTAAPLIFSAHMDVVPVSEQEESRWECPPFLGVIRDDGYLWGRGSSDTKGSLAGVMSAMAFLKKAEITPPGDVILAASVDEENLMRGAKAMVHDSDLQKAKGIIVCEGTGLELIAESRGRTWAEVTFIGDSAHASLKGAGNNAIVHALEFARRLYKKDIPHKGHPLLGEFFWQINMIEGGVEPAMVPDRCVLTVDARLVPGITPEMVWQEVKDIIDEMHEENEKAVASIRVLEAREPWETDLDSPVVMLAKNAYDLLDFPMGRRGQKGTTDGTFLRRMGMDAVMIGPGDSKYNHKANERVPVANLKKAAEIYLTLMLSNSLK